jgi:Doubled CXXCH motif (Paired_CXXCH_1)
LKHKALFPSCTTCHAGAAQSGAPLWPDPASCAACHDGTIQKTITWRAPSSARRSNLRFDHVAHAANAKDKSPSCAGCHTRSGDERMAVRAPVVERCLACHGLQTAHLAAPDTACTTCHVPLARATSLTRQDVAAFPAPPAHAAPDFVSRHGTISRQTLGSNCATCHAREFCYQCHAGSAPPSAITALASDARATAIVARAAPPSHDDNFADRHGAIAAASTTRCTGCHVRSDCLECHRPNAAARGGGYHPAGFLSRHPAAAYARDAACSDCHNVGAFCTSCHARAGLTAAGVLRSGYHDARRFFLAGHGQAARQGLESCVSCHAERDCLTCHSALGGRRFDPHGPGFDAARLRRKAFAMCTVCHGANVPQ